MIFVNRSFPEIEIVLFQRILQITAYIQKREERECVRVHVCVVLGLVVNCCLDFALLAQLFIDR